ncbi:MAG: zf-HC2 domain-containing protein [Candidatus Hydrogenedentes bacterium]|nr:zf-HC2 domain-containing protein [Candidatus Hydrogenedentota bacterium]
MMCADVQQQLVHFADGELEPARAREIERHLAQCAKCRALLGALGRADGALRALAREEPPAEATQAVRGALCDVLEHEQPPAARREIMTLDEVAGYLRIPIEDIIESMGDLPTFELAGHVRVRRTRLLEWIEERERAHVGSIAESDLARILSGGLLPRRIVAGRG